MGSLATLGTLRRTAIALAAVLSMGAATMAAQVNDWAINPAESEADFSVQPVGSAAVHGSVHGISGDIRFEAGDPNLWRVNATIDMRTLSTGTPSEDQQLKGASVLNVAQYPAVTFRSTGVKQDSSSGYRIAGQLTMHGVTRRAVLVLDSPGDARLGMDAMHVNRAFHATILIHPKDFGLNTAIQNDQVKIKLTIEAKEK